MTCNEVRSQLTDYVMDRLGPEHVARINKHLEGCAVCRRDLAVARLVETSETDSGHLHVDSAPVIRIAYAIIEQALEKSAAEILIQPEPHGLQVLYDISGSRREVMPLPKYVQSPLTARLKLMGRLDIARTDTHQEGRIAVRWQERDYDFTISCNPTEHGEQVVMRKVG